MRRQPLLGVGGQTGIHEVRLFRDIFEPGADLVFFAGIDEDEKFLNAFAGLDNGFEPVLRGALDLKGSGGLVSTEGFTSEGMSDDHPFHSGKAFDAFDEASTFLGSTLVSATCGHSL